MTTGSVNGGRQDNSHAGPVRELPTGTVTFLFTDIEGSTKLWQTYQGSMPHIVARHEALLREAVERNGGVVFKTVGDAVCAAFPTAAGALEAAVAGQRALGNEQWGSGISLRVRMALHTGMADVRDGDYVGHTLNRVARLVSAGHGGQILLSDVTHELVHDHLPEGVKLADLGVHRLKDLERPEHIFQVTAPDLPSEFAPLVTADVRHSNLPAEHTPFVGREEDVRAVADSLLRDDVRLMTLTGPGGTGKTRLALRVASRVIDHFRDGTFFVPLAPVTESSLVAGSIAAALGIKEVHGQPAEETLRSAVAQKQMLLVLDNFEHLLGAEPVVADLLSTPGLTILVTSRSALRLSAEREYAVAPLPVPDPQHLPDPRRLLQYDAVALFVQRAQAVKADFTITDENAAAVASICSRLDGLPLAIELAAARIRLFPPQALLRRLDRRLQVLTGGARDLPARQQTLRAALDWSYQLLNPAEQRLFEMLSVFSGASFEAIDSVASSSESLARTIGDALETLTSLVDSSLIRQVGAGAEEPRFAMLETIREYAGERLSQEPDVNRVALRAHAAYFADLAEEQWDELTRGDREAAWGGLVVESENLRRAWNFWVGESDLDQLNKLVDSLWRLYDRRGWYRATVELITQMLDVLSSCPPAPERRMQEVTLRTGLARTLLAIHGYTQEVEDAYARALEAVGAEGELPQVFPVLRGLASLYINRTKFEDALRVGQDILRLAEEQQDPSVGVDGHLLVGTVLVQGQDIHGGLQHIERALACFESPEYQTPRFRFGPSPGIATLTTSAFALWYLGYPDQALQRADHAVDVARAMEHPLSLAYAYYHTGLLHWWRREPEHARDRATSVLDVASEHDLTIWRAVGTFLLGAAKAGLGQPEGLAEIREGLDLYLDLRSPPVFWPLLLYVRAQACSLCGEKEEGLRSVNESLEISGARATYAPELFLVKGELLLAEPGRNEQEAQELFLRAFDGAEKMDARMLQLRAAVALCRLDGDRGEEGRGHQLLSSVYASFTEGLAVPDLVEARQLLNQPVTGMQPSG